MYLNQLTTLLYTRQLPETVEWYQQIMGFTCTDFVPDWGYARVQLNEAAIMIVYPNEHIPFETPHLTGSLYINTTDVDAWWEKLKDKCKICYPIENFAYGMREFAVYDYNGYLLQFGQEINLNHHNFPSTD